MKRTCQTVVLLAALAGGCQSEGDHPQPAAKPAETSAAMPALPILPPRGATAAKPGQPAASDPRLERFTAIQAAYDQAQNDYYTAFRTALGDIQNPTREQLEKIRSELKAPDPKEYAAKAHELVDEDPTDLAAFRALAWLLDNEQDVQVDEANGTATIGPGKGRAGILALLEKHHMDRAEMGELCSRFSQCAPALLEKLVANSPHEEVRGQACYAMAEGLKQDLETAGEVKAAEGKDLEDLKGWLGADRIAALRTLDVDATQKKMEQVYERIVRDFAGIQVGAGTKRETTLGKQAGAALHEIRDLVVGKPAPEIEGVDMDEVAFKLSDYRGKVVLLDFWGNW